ncbi:protein adenylyltransferase SelO [Methyloradius palustris]|uniref:Protein nucleotidyltransferase YdiU n=1 Tax=Methyloradius palustris TaxID=2778876 RepID=A0A8D5GDN8_9PROT|nr:YdiU family protein [Methyloradius palustris]BCM24714.1 UPF0061 protein [Methyloradius palustris]
MLNFDNRLLRELPGDSETHNHLRQVVGASWSAVTPTPVAAPELLAYSPEMAKLLDIDDAEMQSPEMLKALSGNGLLAGMQTYATCYGGHQFGHWAGQLGDGRAIFLGETVNKQGQRWELQLKGAGVTPYSRRADGRAVLRSSVREFLCSEAMHHLGIATTRALSLVKTGDQVVRDMFYDGNPKAELGAIVCRVAPSFTRFGHFELPASRGDHALLQQLIVFTIQRDFPDLVLPEPLLDESKTISEKCVVAWFTEICERTAKMIAKWMQVGFVHGVMNTDNMSILGLTIDYGPYGWVDNFDPGWTPNTTDAAGRRYCFGRQPEIARWNLERLADAIGVLLVDSKILESGLRHYDVVYNAEWTRVLAGKFGFNSWQENDGALINDIFGLMYQAEVDMTDFFRRLAVIDIDNPTPEALKNAFYREDLYNEFHPAFSAWLSSYVERLRQDARPNAERIASMHQFNPRYVLRNYLAQQAIDLAESGDNSMIIELLDVMRKPYDEQPGRERYSEKRPDWARHKAGCSSLSCSS